MIGVMAPYAPAHPLEEAVADEVEVIRSSGPRGVGKRLDLSDPRTINKEVVVALSRRISPEAIADKIGELLEMKRQTKAGLIPDARAMEAGIKLYLAYAVGLPVQRQELVTVAINADSMTGLRERLKSSPAMRDALAGLLAEVAEESTKTDGIQASAEQIIDG